MWLLRYTADAKPAVLKVVASTWVDVATAQVQTVSEADAVVHRARPVVAAWAATAGGRATEVAGIDNVSRISS